MGHRSHKSHYMRELERKVLDSGTLAETSLATLIKTESEKIQDLIKRNAPTETLLESSKIFSQTVYNIALAQLVPLLKNDKNMPTAMNLINQTDNSSGEENITEDFEPSEDNTEMKAEAKASSEAGANAQYENNNVVSNIFSLLAQYLTNNAFISPNQNNNSVEK